MFELNDHQILHPSQTTERNSTFKCCVCECSENRKQMCVGRNEGQYAVRTGIVKSPPKEIQEFGRLLSPIVINSSSLHPAPHAKLVTDNIQLCYYFL